MIDIWPDIKLKFNLFNDFSVDYLENIIEKKFPNSNPVLLSSGRSAIVSCLRAFNLKRESKVSYSPYANSCIFRTVGEVSSPIPAYIKDKFDCQLVYHQWGYIQKTNVQSLIIEDSIDSLIINSKGLFPNGGEFEIMSMSKIFGTPYGAIVFCKDENYKKNLLNIRNKNRNFSKMQFLIKFLSKSFKIAESYWSQMEPLNAWPGNGINKLIYNNFNNYENIITDRKKKIAILKDFLFYEISPFRLPIALPLKLNYNQLMKLQNLNKFKIFERHINMSRNYNNWELHQFFPMPIHQEVPIELVQEVGIILK